MALHSRWYGILHFHFEQWHGGLRSRRWEHFAHLQCPKTSLISITFSDQTLKVLISNDNQHSLLREHLNGWQLSEELILIWGLCQCLLLTLTFWTFDFGVVVGEKCNQQICGLKLWIREGVPNQTGYYDACWCECVCVYALKAHLKFVPSDQRSCSCKLWFLLKVVQSNGIQCILLCYQPPSEQYL